MHYISTRGGGPLPRQSGLRPREGGEPFDFAHDKPKRFSEILLEGLAPDGGLYVPESYPAVSSKEFSAMRAMNYPELAFTILSKYADGIPSEDLRRIVNETYTKDIFGSDEIVPLKKLEDGFYILGLSEGPTLAFKDIALQLLGRLFEYTLTKKDETLNILGATSGDTGSAAEYAVRGRKGIKIFMLSPHGRMSEFQKKQMYTLQDPNIFNIVIRGTFDDCQDIVKVLNEDAEFKKKYRLGAVNSINWARVAAQVVYYFWAYLRVTSSNREVVSFAVPTGNFGNMLAGYVAKRMGLPVKNLFLATNENNVLEEFFKTGVYRPRKGKEVHATSSPSMDVSKASNFERYMFDLVERDSKRMNELLGDLRQSGSFAISKSEREKLKRDNIIGGSSTHADRLHTIRMLYETYGARIDPHTADGVKVGLEHREIGPLPRRSGLRPRGGGIPLVCLETALPAKFAATIREAIGKESEIPERFSQSSELPERFELFGPEPAKVKEYVAAHI